MMAYTTPPRPSPDQRLISSPFLYDHTIAQIPKVTIVSRIVSPIDRRCPGWARSPAVGSHVPAGPGAGGGGGGGDGGGGGGADDGGGGGGTGLCPGNDGGVSLIAGTLVERRDAPPRSVPPPLPGTYAPDMANAWFESVAVAQRRAERRLPKSVYGALIAGADRGISMEDNVNAFAELGLRPVTVGQQPTATWRRPSSICRSRCR